MIDADGGPLSSFEDVLDQALARARRALLEEHEKQVARAARTAVTYFPDEDVAEGVAMSASLKDMGSKKTGSRRRHRSLSSSGLKTLNAIIESATQGVTTVTERRTALDRLMEMSSKGVSDGLMAAVIVLNTATIGISTDVEPDWFGWLVVDTMFAVIFFCEMLAKIIFRGGLREYFFGSGWRWNNFEFLLVALAVLELITSLQSQGQKTEETDTRTLMIFRIFRLARIARILRMSRLAVFSDLLMMINGATGGIRTFCWSVILISLPLYSVALLLTDSLKDSVGSLPGAEMFENVGTSFFTVFRCMVGSDCTDLEGRPIFVLITQKSNWVFGLIYCVSSLVMTFGLFNVIVAIYVENIVAAAKFNDAHSKRQRLRDAELFAEKSTQLVEFIWRQHIIRCESLGEEKCPAQEVAQLEIEPDFLVELRAHAEFQDILRDLDVADEDQLDLFDTLDVDGGGSVDIEELIVGIAKLRGDARRSDIVSVGLVVRSVQLTIQGMESKVMRELRAHSEAIKALERLEMRSCFASEACTSKHSDVKHVLQPSTACGDDGAHEPGVAAPEQVTTHHDHIRTGI